MSPLEYLRRRRSPLTPERRQLFLEATEAVEIGVRSARTVTENAPAGDRIACGCWPHYVTCRCAGRAENGA